ncbi:MAG: hypothetical protein JNJ46_08055 [Myxococcales bacterium]|nr:hypothetical protein [Myxococcales bacterium]
MADPVLWTLAGTTAATVLFLLERRAKLRPTALDAWAATHHFPLQRDVPAHALSSLEPLALLPTVMAVERLAQGTLRSDQLAMSTTLSVCVVGGERQARRFLLGAFGGHPDMPALRVLPASVRDAPSHLGFVEMPAAGLPDAYRIESFQPLRTDLTQALGAALRDAGGDGSYRIELRSGRILIAAPHQPGGSPDALIALGARLSEQLFTLLGPPAEAPEPNQKAGGSCKTSGLPPQLGGCGSCGCG